MVGLVRNIEKGFKWMAQMKRQEGSGGSEGWPEELELGARLLTVEKKKK